VAQSGLRAALLARAGFLGPATVFEGTHGLFNGFAHTRAGDYAALLDEFGGRWVAETLAFKPYPCGTMIQPFIDCARRLHGRVRPEDIAEIVCEVGEGTVHRLWEPLAAKQAPPNGYAAKFSTPYCIAAAILDGNIGLSAFTDTAVARPQVRALAGKIRYQVDPANPYPTRFTGHVRVRLANGRTVEERQPHLRGGASEPLSRAELEEKFAANVRLGGWPPDRADAALRGLASLWNGPVDLTPLRG
jgi:2-methylcitrate dehydratase PrpD